MVAFLKISLLMLSGTSTTSSFLMINPLSIPTTALHADSQMDVDDNHFNPCSWQEIWDDDCDMSSIFAASFIAKDWIKSMPCAAGIEDCDMPQELNAPRCREEGGVENIDVMSLLGIKRVDNM